MPIAMLQLLFFWSGDGWLLSLSPLNASRVWFSYPFPFLPCKLAYLDQIVSSIFDSCFSCLFFIQVLKCFLYPVRFLLFACIKAFAVHSLKIFNPLVDCSCHCYILLFNSASERLGTFLGCITPLCGVLCIHALYVVYSTKSIFSGS